MNDNSQDTTLHPSETTLFIVKFIAFLRDIGYDVALWFDIARYFVTEDIVLFSDIHRNDCLFGKRDLNGFRCLFYFCTPKFVTSDTPSTLQQCRINEITVLFLTCKHQVHQTKQLHEPRVHHGDTVNQSWLHPFSLFHSNPSQSYDSNEQEYHQMSWKWVYSICLWCIIFFCFNSVVSCSLRWWLPCF